MIDFQFHNPTSLDDALAMLQRYGPDARLMAGGTALVLQMKQRFAQPAHIIGLRPLTSTAGLNEIAETPDGLRIGALTTLRRLQDHPLLRARNPLLTQAAARVATRRIRSMATIGGALANGDPNQDIPPALIALDASVELTSPNGARAIPVASLFLDYYETAIAPDEILTAVLTPTPPAGARAAYLKFLPRTADDYATVSAAAVIIPGPNNECRDVRIVLAAAGPIPIRARAAENLLLGQELTPDAIRAAADTVPDIVDPLDDLRGSADYKREMAAVFTRRALTQALESSAVESPTGIAL